MDCPVPSCGGKVKGKAIEGVFWCEVHRKQAIKILEKDPSRKGLGKKDLILKLTRDIATNKWG